MRQTPYFEFKIDSFQRNLLAFKKFQENGIDVFYALKANNYEPIVSGIVQAGFGFDVASMEEINLAISHGAKPEKISFSAPSKFPDDVKEAVLHGVEYFAFDSEAEARKIIRQSSAVALFARVSTRTRNAAFNLSEKFGMDQEYFNHIIKLAKEENWPLSGLSFHIGSQNIGEEAWEEGFALAKEYIEFARSQGIKITLLNIGGGIPAQYDESIKPVEEYISVLIERVKKLKKEISLEKIIIEPGRAMVANTMDLYTSVIDLKPYKEPKLLILDSSVFGGVIEALEHFEYPIKSLDKNQSEKSKFRIGGYTCDSYDIIKQEALLPSNIEVGDCLVIEQAGAYTSVFSEFQMKPFPKIYNKE